MNQSPQIAVEPLTRTPGMYREWYFFKNGDRIEIWSENTFLFAARVDDRTDDGEVLWVIEEKTGMRRLFLRSDKVTLYPDYAFHTPSFPGP